MFKLSIFCTNFVNVVFTIYVVIATRRQLTPNLTTKSNNIRSAIDLHGNRASYNLSTSVVEFELPAVNRSNLA